MTGGMTSGVGAKGSIMRRSRRQGRRRRRGRAQAVVRADGKQLGYIPRAALDEFEAFNPKNLPCPFTGRITVDTSNHLFGTLHITQPGF